MTLEDRNKLPDPGQFQRPYFSIKSFILSSKIWRDSFFVRILKESIG